MEEAETTDATLELLTRLRADYPWVGVALQADLVRTESDCRELAVPGSRVRLCKGAYRPPFGAFESRQEIDLSFVRCLKVLLAGSGYPMIATHDPTMIEIARSLIVRNGRSPETYEFQMLRGIRPDEQMTLVGAGRTVRVYVPYGPDWRPWVMRRLIERPANLALFARSMLAGG
jgi:proline dehydrogenase